MSLSWLPNALSLLRLAAIPPLIVLLLNGAHLAAVVVFFLAGASDALDGWLAKRYGWHSPFGAALDAAADKLLMASIFITLGWLGLVPVWLVVLVFGRDLGIVLGAAYARRRLQDFDVRPSLIGKLHTAVLILFVLVIMIDAGWQVFDPSVIVGAVTVAALSILVSGTDYLLAFLRDIRERMESDS